MEAAVSEPTITLDVWKCVHETRDALIVKLSEYSRDLVVPLSVIDASSEVWGHGDKGTLVVAKWWAQKKGIA